MPSRIADSVLAICAMSGLDEFSLIDSHGLVRCSSMASAALRTNRLPPTSTIVRVSALPCAVMLMSTDIPVTRPSRTVPR